MTDDRFKTFPGDVLEWPVFQDILIGVHDNSDVPRVQKVVYLKSLSTGRTAGYVANIKTEEAIMLPYDISKDDTVRLRC